MASKRLPCKTVKCSHARDRPREPRPPRLPMKHRVKGSTIGFWATGFDFDSIRGSRRVQTADADLRGGSRWKFLGVWVRLHWMWGLQNELKLFLPSDEGAVVCSLL